jgi:hypothetical protein
MKRTMTTIAASVSLALAFATTPALAGKGNNNFKSGGSNRSLKINSGSKMRMSQPKLQSTSKFSGNKFSSNKLTAPKQSPTKFSGNNKLGRVVKTTPVFNPSKGTSPIGKLNPGKLNPGKVVTPFPGKSSINPGKVVTPFPGKFPGKSPIDPGMASPFPGTKPLPGKGPFPGGKPPVVVNPKPPVGSKPFPPIGPKPLPPIVVNPKPPVGPKPLPPIGPKPLPPIVVNPKPPVNPNPQPPVDPCPPYNPPCDPPFCGGGNGFPFPFPVPYPTGGYCPTPIVQPVYTQVAPVSYQAEAPVAVEGVDLELVEVRQIDRGDVAQQLGPAYRITLRNRTGAAVAQQFNVALAGSIGREVTADSAMNLVRVEGLEAGQSLTVDLRLPATAYNMGLNADGQPVPFTWLTAMVDTHQEVEQTDRDNDYTVLNRREIVMAAL